MCDGPAWPGPQDGLLVVPNSRSEPGQRAWHRGSWFLTSSSLSQDCGFLPLFSAFPKPDCGPCHLRLCTQFAFMTRCTSSDHKTSNFFVFVFLFWELDSVERWPTHPSTPTGLFVQTPDFSFPWKYLVASICLEKKTNKKTPLLKCPFGVSTLLCSSVTSHQFPPEVFYLLQLYFDLCLWLRAVKSPVCWMWVESYFREDVVNCLYYSRTSWLKKNKLV